MAFNDDLERLGIDLNFNSEKNLPTPEQHRIAPLLSAVLKLWEPQEEDSPERIRSHQEMKDLLAICEAGGELTNEQRRQAAGDLKTAWFAYTELAPDKKMAFKMNYQQHVDEARALYQDDAISQIRDDIGKAHTLEEMDAVLTSMQQAMSTSPLSFGNGTEETQLAKDFRAKLGVRWDMFGKDLSDRELLAGFQDGKEQVQAHMTAKQSLSGRHLLEEFREWILQTCDKMEAADQTPEARRANRGFGLAYKRQKSAYLADPVKRANLDSAKKVSAVVERQIESIHAVADLSEKMEAESGGHHRDSDEYTTMKTCARIVVEKQKYYDPDDKRSVAEMEEALNRLHDAAEKYAEKEAFKSKKTTRGIERKNTALALLAVTDPNGIEGVEKYMADEGRTVQDFRRDKKEDKKSRTLRSLIEEEKTSAHGMAEERREKRKAARAMEKQGKVAQDTHRAHVTGK